MINRNNYESYVIDYLDGTLSPAETAELVLFLEQNPDIAAEVELLNEGIQFTPDQEGFPDKAMLKKDVAVVPDDELDLLMARAVEGDLSPDEKLQLEQRLSHSPELSRHMKAMASAKLSPVAVSFADKNSLKVAESVQLTADENLLVALLEGDLSKKESDSLRARMDREPVLQNEFRILQSARLTASSEVFEHKQSLYRKKTMVIPLRRALYFTTASAAAVLLFVTLFWKSDPVPADGFATWEPEQWQWSPSKTDSDSTEAVIETTPDRHKAAPRRTLPPSYEPRDPGNDVADARVNPLEVKPKFRIDKITLIGDATLASFHRSDELKTVTSSIVEPIPDYVAQIPAPSEPQRYPTIIEYLGEKAKHKIFGDDVPEEDVALAAVEKGIRKAVKDDVILSRKSCGNDKGFHIKLGKLEICRSRRG